MSDNKKEVQTQEKSGFTFQVKRRVTLPLLKPQLDVPVYVRVDGQVFQGKEVKQAAGTAKMEAAQLMNVTNLETGEAAQMIVPSVLLGIFQDEYKDGAYVGTCFEIVKHPKGSGKRYHPFSVTEIEVK